MGACHVMESAAAQKVSVTANEKSENQVFWPLGDAHEDSDPIQANNQSRSAKEATCNPGDRERTSEERLHLDALEPARARVAEHEARDGEDALALDEQLELPILLPDVVQAHALPDRRARARGELERAATNRGAVRVVALGLGRDVADRLVRGVVGREVRVDLALTVRAPHEARGEAAVVATAARARGRDVEGITANCE